MPKLMKPVTFGCENGFQELYYDVEDPTNKSKIQAGKVYCYLDLLKDSEKKDTEILKKCMSMKSGQCWKRK